MPKRGRPRHPDILTPREWDVLALLREELSNAAIGQRLGITERTAKYHVGEILGKLAVASRHEAAAWQPEAAASRPEAERPRWSLAGAPFAFWRGAGLGWLSAGAAGMLVLAVSGGLGLLAWSLLSNEASPASPEAVRTLAFDVNTYRDEELGIEFSYPVDWSADVADPGVRPCAGCGVLGPGQPPATHGVRVYEQVRPQSCWPCAAGNGHRQLGETESLSINGYEAVQFRIMANLPVGFANQDPGRHFLDQEVYTGFPFNADAIFIVAFYPDGDAHAEAETLAAYDMILVSVRLSRE